MTVSSMQRAGFAVAVIDALSAHICVLDRNGQIIAVNHAWQNFGVANSHLFDLSDIGRNYLEICQSSSGPGAAEADDFATGIQAVLDGGTLLFQMEYPCHSPTVSRWFLGRVTPLELPEGGAVISHENITSRRLLEIELEKLAATDALTGLPNRRYFLDRANIEFEKVRRFHAKVSLVMIDVDNFKAVNDTHGHAAGDEVLKSISRGCRDRLRQSDVLARFGGEEFVILLCDTNAVDAVFLAEILRKSVEEGPVKIDDGIIFVTASFGITQISSEDATIDTALARADKALYMAKRAGRNRVRQAEMSSSLSVAAKTSPIS
ncbi:diguanylate cyclase [Pararhizobium sp. PWRC1-1]|uniref:GGDEF domain-containing protein n=1 Tax=Pararhizobium sp. PWRC1-1 TaxID=2804566 RepID=UPI003CFA6B15